MITGRWANNSRYRPLAHQIRGVDPIHTTEWYGEGVEVPEAPPSPDYGQPGEHPWTDWVVDAPGVRVDQLPTGHDVPQSHVVDYGEARGAGELPALNFDERYQSESFAGMATQLPPYGKVRGRHARPEMNPTDPPRAGLHLRRVWADRARWTGHRVTDRRITREPGVVLPDLDLDTTPDVWGRYSSPFSVWARGLNGPMLTPQIRRVPTTIDESTLDDAADDEGIDAEVDAGWVW
jgi:hypothetical protein